MKRPWLILALASLAFGQSGNKLEADLQSMPGSRQLTDDILALAPADAQPSRRVVMDFTNELTMALAGARRSPENVAMLARAIADVMQSDGVPTWKYRATLHEAQQALISMKVFPQMAQHAADKLRVLGQQVRGPEDLPVTTPVRLAPK
jgi:hypothetical protein